MLTESKGPRVFYRLLAVLIRESEWASYVPLYTIIGHFADASVQFQCNRLHPYWANSTGNSKLQCNALKLFLAHVEACANSNNTCVPGFTHQSSLERPASIWPRQRSLLRMVVCSRISARTSEQTLQQPPTTAHARHLGLGGANRYRMDSNHVAARRTHRCLRATSAPLNSFQELMVSTSLQWASQ